ncbi:MAG: alkaline phosphatase family protein [Dehalococcoidia bacterium]|nr:alkaline phosphatase family protein [Dehalococcoidia bacterium]
MIFVLGLDAATWTVISPNLYELPNFRKLCEIGKCSDLIITEKPVSPSIWCGMFCGKSFAQHGHDSFVVADNIVKREDIKVDFIWDILQRKGKKAIALNVPFVVPPFSFGVDYKPVGFGLPTDEKEWHAELETITAHTKELLVQKPDLLISVYTLLDRVQHFHWGEDCVLGWYKKLDSKIGELLFDTRFLEDEANRLIIISDHGFCSFGEAKIQTLPKETKQGTLKGDHHENALLITVNLDYEISKPQDVFYAIKKQLLTGSK